MKMEHEVYLVKEKIENQPIGAPKAHESPTPQAAPSISLRRDSLTYIFRKTGTFLKQIQTKQNKTKK